MEKLTTQEKIDLNHKVIDLRNRQQELLVQKTDQLRMLLSETWVGGEGEKTHFVPVFTDGEAKIIKAKLMSLIDKF